jgi:hypothetical protein
MKKVETKRSNPSIQFLRKNHSGRARIKILGALISTTIFLNVNATTHTNKTFLMPRSHNPNLAMEYTTWHDQIKRKDDDMFNGTIQAVPFYQKSNNKKDLGQYFSISNRTYSDRIDDYIEVSDVETSHLTVGDIIHYYPNDYPVLGKITFRPYQESCGVRLDYHQKLDKFVNGLFIKINMPIVSVKHSMGYTYTWLGTQNLPTDSNITNAGAGYPELNAAQCTGASKTMEDYFTGNVENLATQARQYPLNYYRIHNGKTKFGVADINIVLGYNFVYKESKHFNVNTAFLIPTGNAPDGKYRFEPVVGNGGHFGWGIGVDTAFELWNDNNKSVEFSIVTNYKYLFKGTEKRTLDFKYANTGAYTHPNERSTWGPYKIGGAYGDTHAEPLANFLTKDLNVTPRGEFDMMFDFAVNVGNWTIDLGYELFAKANEKVSLKHTWSDNRYGNAYIGWNTTKAFISGTTIEGGGGYETIYRGYNSSLYWNGTDVLTQYTIDSTHLLFDDAETPVQVTHKFFAGFGYAENANKYPWMLGVGASIELTSNNAALALWALWLKLGISF